MNSIEGKWQEYRTRVVPKDASETQVMEARRAFYAGAGSLFSIVLDLADKKVSEKAGVAVVRSIDEEIRLFSIAVLDGRA